MCMEFPCGIGGLIATILACFVPLWCLLSCLKACVKRAFRTLHDRNETTRLVCEKMEADTTLNIVDPKKRRRPHLQRVQGKNPPQAETSPPPAATPQPPELPGDIELQPIAAKPPQLPPRNTTSTQSAYIPHPSLQTPSLQTNITVEPDVHV